MRKIFGWTGLAALVVSTLISAPQAALAGERCENRGYRNGGNQYSYRDNQDYRARRGDYRDDRNSGYDSYSNYGYNNSGYSTYGNNNSYGDSYGNYGTRRSTGQSAAIIGGGAAAGAAVGGLTGGRKGALIGAAVGGIGGLIYDRTTRNSQNPWRPW